MARRDEDVAGLGGWLILLAVYVFLVPFGWAFLIVEDVFFYREGIWAAYTSSNSIYYLPYFKGYYIFDNIKIVILFLFDLFLIAALLNKSNLFPRMMIVFISTGILLNIIDIFLFELVFEESLYSDEKELLVLAIVTFSQVIGILYLIYSKRVKNTFIEPLTRELDNYAIQQMQERHKKRIDNFTSWAGYAGAVILFGIFYFDVFNLQPLNSTNMDSFKNSLKGVKGGALAVAGILILFIVLSPFVFIGYIFSKIYNIFDRNK